MRIIFSRDRAAQLDLLLRSLGRNAPAETTKVIWWASDHLYMDAYAEFRHWSGWTLPTPPAEFRERLLGLLEHTSDSLVTFFCDDDVVFRPLLASPSYWLRNPSVLCFSWRLCSDPGAWEWRPLPRTDHGYPGSLDGHTFRVTDVLHMLYNADFGDPNVLEQRLVEGCETLGLRRPLMAAPSSQVLVGVPVNRVSETSGCPYGDEHPQSAHALNSRFRSGARIDLDALDFSGVNGCHHEIPFVWTAADEVAA